MTDRELLELAAKAAGYVLDADGDRLDQRENGGSPMAWNPLTDDGDALRLAVTIRGSVEVWGGSSNNGPCTTFEHDEFSLVEKHGDDPYAATRRAVVRAAAEIGKAMQQEHRRTTP